MKHASAAPGVRTPPRATAALSVIAIALGISSASAAPETSLQPRVFTFPDLIQSTPTRPSSQRPGRPLEGEQVKRLLQAQSLRESGKMDAAREILIALLAESPHQPVVLAELARTYVERQQWPAVERLARAERAATRDSVLLGRELELALERLSKLREAGQVVIEAWCAAPSEADWAQETLARLEPQDPRGFRELLRRAVEARPARVDIALCAVRRAWLRGDDAVALRILAATDATRPSTPARWGFAEELLSTGTPRDSAGAVDALIALAADRSLDPGYRLPAARRAWQVTTRRGAGHEGVVRVAQALADLPPAVWASDLLVGVVRGLREGGDVAEVRSLLDRLGDRRDSYPELKVEGALNELREGPPERVLGTLEAAAHGSIEGVFRYAEALFFAGMPDSAASMYRLVSHDPGGPYTGPALERLFLIEDAQPREALRPLGRLAYEEWRGDAKGASVLAESLYHSLPRGPLWANAALALATQRERSGDAKGALEPLLAVADSLADDRLAPVARQRAGDLYRLRLKDDAHALEQYEACLTRYPKAWNASEVRRAVETLRRERRF